MVRKRDYGKGHVVMDMTGHRTRSVFDRYNITSPKDLRDAAQRLDAYLQTHIEPA